MNNNSKNVSTIEEFRSHFERTKELAETLNRPIAREALDILFAKSKLLLHRRVEGLTSGEAFYEARGYDRALQDLISMAIYKEPPKNDRPSFYTPDDKTELDK